MKNRLDWSDWLRNGELIKAERCEKDIIREREREREGAIADVEEVEVSAMTRRMSGSEISVGFDRVWKRGALCEELKMLSLCCRRRVGCVVFGFHVNIYLNCYSNGTIFICDNVMFLIFFLIINFE